MVILGVIVTYFLLSAVLVTFACMLSSMVSRREGRDDADAGDLIVQTVVVRHERPATRQPERPAILP